MNQQESTQGLRRYAVMAAVVIAAILVIAAVAWFCPTGWLVWAYGGLFVIMMLVILLHSVHEDHVISRTVVDALHGRDRLTDVEFGRRYYADDLAPLAAQVRRMLADNLGCALSGMTPSDDFEKWLCLSSGVDSAADSFFEELAIEFQLTRDAPWPQRFESFDALVKFVKEHSFGGRAEDSQYGSVDA
jgi:hypothetical protein